MRVVAERRVNDAVPLSYRLVRSRLVRVGGSVVRWRRGVGEEAGL